MTARSTAPSSVAISAKREDTTPKARKRTGVRGADPHATIHEVRSRGTNTSNLSAEEMAEVISPNKPLTEKQKLFVKFWAEGDSIPSASLRAGYNDHAAIAYRMVKMPNILALKHKYEVLYEEAAQITRKSVMDMHIEAYSMAKLMSEPATMVAAARELGKMAGYYAPVEHKVKVDVTGNVVLDRLNGMTDAELLQIISKSAPVQLLEDFSDSTDASSETDLEDLS